MSEAKEKQRRRESPSGHHFYTLYQDCPRKWYLKYVNGLTPAVTASPLIIGSAFHEGKAQYWLNDFDADGFLKIFEDEMDQSEEEYRNHIDWEADKQRGLIMVDNWLVTWHEDNMQRFEVIEAEKEHRITFGPNGEFVFTIRPDVVLFDKEIMAKVIEDSKTTGWSLDRIFNTNSLADQMTSYLWGLKKDTSYGIEYARIDGTFERKGKATSERSTLIYRTNHDLQVFELSLYGLISEVSQKYKSLKKYPHPLLFPRNGNQCFKYNKNCEYADICRMNVRIGDVPPGFKLDPWAELDSEMTKVQGDLDRFLLSKEG